MELTEYLELIKGETKLENEIINDKKLSPEAKIYYAAIQGLKQNNFKISNQEIKALFNFNDDDIQKYRQELVEAGWGDNID